MTERISATDVEQISKLAFLRFDDAETATLVSQLGDILNHIDELSQIDLSDVEPTAHPFPLRNVMREDVVVETLERDDVLNAAPNVEQNRFAVPPSMGDA